MAAPFSRLQLAAALLEYDNDPSNPDAPHRSAHESAIFAHLRRNVRPNVATRRSDYLGVSLPSETGSLSGRESALDGRRSRASIDALRNPFRASDHLEDDVEGIGEEMEVDLASWGLDAFMAKDKDSKKARSKNKSQTQPVLSVPAHQPQTNTATIPPRRTARSLSVGNYDHLSLPADHQRRKSFGSPLDLAGLESPDIQFHHKSAVPSSAADLPHSIPFPTTSTRTPSPFPEEQDGHQRTASNASKVLLGEDGPRHARTVSMGSMTSRLLADDNPFALRPPSRASRFDPKAALHARTMSNASMGSRMLLDDGVSLMSGVQPPNADRPYSTLELLRPKVLVMPSPLQGAPPPPPPPEPKARDGFQLSTDGPPLPPGARSAPRSSTFMGDTLEPVASNSFTPNPRMNLSLSQLTFRNTLMIGGQRDVAYSDVDGELPRATEEGQQVFPYTDEPDTPQELVNNDAANKANRPPGKLYGKSLIDDLENRKAQMRTKQRVFTGDNRPSMMKRSSTLIDPASLQGKPGTQRMSSYGSTGTNLARRNSTGPKPLLNFDEEGIEVPISPATAARGRSVFGVDTLWQREMAKLKEIEAQEQKEAEERAKKEAEEEATKTRKKAKKKGKNGGLSPLPQDVHGSVEAMESRVPTPPPVLPVIQSAVRGPPPPVDEAEDSDSDHSEAAARPQQPSGKNAWNSDSSDEEKPEPRRTTGVGPRFRSVSGQRPSHSQEDDSDEDLPLAATLQRPAKHTPQNADSDDEAQPLSIVLQKAQATLTRQNVEDDDEPLALRASRVGLSSTHDDDDQPLGLHPEQQRRTQYQMMAQQQQMFMQAQMQNSMFFNQSMMGSGFFPSPMATGMMMQPPPMPIPSPPPMHDAAKFARVDNWRHDVAGT